MAEKFDSFDLKILAELQANGGLSNQEVADRVGLSRTVFAQRFTALVGRPPLAYLTWWRMTAAARLLRETDGPLSAVARRCGYASEFAFAKAFKRAYGSTPGQYRHHDETELDGLADLG